MSNTTLSKEMELAVKHYNLSLKDLERLTINAMKSSFAHYDERIKIIYDVLKPGYAEVEKHQVIMDIKQKADSKRPHRDGDLQDRF